MKRWSRFLLITGVAVMAMSSSVFAGSWRQNQIGWYWEEKDGTYPAASWQWLDGNQDGVSECYYFDETGYLLTDTITPDGHQVDGEGRWIVDGQVQSRDESTQPLSASEQYAAAVKKTSELNSIAVNTVSDLAMSLEGMTLKMNMNFNFKAKDIDSLRLQYIADIKMDFIGETSKVTVFYTDGTGYQTDDDDREKFEVPSYMAAAAARNITAGLLPEVQYLQDVQVSGGRGGSSVVTFTITQEGMKEQLRKFGQSSMLFSDGRINQYKENHGTIVISPDGYVVSSDISVKYEADYSGSTIGYNVKMNVNYVNPGQPVQFTLPSTEGYKE